MYVKDVGKRETDNEQRGKIKKGKPDIYNKYGEILDMPDLTEKQIDQMRKHLGLLARTICKHVWEKKFY